jgi:hypothetical protein
MRRLHLRVASAYFAAAVGLAAISAQAAVNFDSDVVGGAVDGDFNENGIADAADYVLWRKNVGSNTALPNDGGLGTPIGNNHYDLWRAAFGDTGGGTVFAFEDPSIWDADTYVPVPSVGNETAPPGADSIWFAEDNSVDITIVLSDERSGQNGTEAMGTFAFGGETGTNDFNANITLVLNNSVTLTGIERDDAGEPEGAGGRPLRLGRENINPVGSAAGGTTDDAPWGILLHRAGTLQYDPATVPAGSARMDMSRDKPNSGGAMYEISGDAVLNLAGAVRFGDRDNGGSRTTPGGIFRVRGSTPTVNVDDFIHESRLGLWDHDNIVDSDNPVGVTQMNLGKFVAEFVLDEDGVAPISVADELRLGRTEDLDGNREIGYAFLRLKLSEPTTAGSGAVGSGDELVLFRADRVTSLIDLGDPSSEIEMGRFFDPDRAGLNSSGTTMLPHAGLWENGTVVADYAGATYQWTINYFDSPDDGTIVDAVVLSNLQITGTQGDLSGNGTLGAEDRQALVDAIAAPPTTHIAAAQNVFDLNADEAVDDLDLVVFDAHFSALGAAAAVPEPGAIVLVLAATVALLPLRRRFA